MAADRDRQASEKAERPAARELVGNYHRAELRKLLDHVRAGFAQLDSGAIDEFELDDLIHQYKRAAANLWSFCGSSGGQWVQAAKSLQYLETAGEPSRDWWEEAAPRR
ncbi:MAG TPA: hypothetical protein VFH54_16675 [Mycobacteriales bacterium]|nr:hypothetical protein [Mycobacteriales bacterium]